MVELPMKRLSIVTTMYKTAAYLPKCIESFLDQDIPAEEYEIILVNDGSPDRDLEIAQEYAAKYPNIRVISHENKGLAGARNSGVAAANGKYLRFVDPDDYIERQGLAKLLDRMDDENLDMLRFNYQMVNEKYESVAKPKDAQIIDYSSGIYDGKKYLCERQGFACFVWTFIYRTELIKGIPFRQGDYFDDTAWIPQVFCAAARVDTVSDVCSYYLQRSDSLVNTSGASGNNKKLEAQLVLVGRLKEKLQDVDPYVRKWYDGMIAKVTLSTLTSCAIYSIDVCKQFINSLDSMSVFPLKPYMVTRNQKVKYLILNISPFWFCKLYGKINKA